jgi:DNA-binding transcriptional MocR family regulator
MNESSPFLARRTLGAHSSAVRDLLKYSKAAGIISLAGGIPAPDLFDIDGLEAALAAELSARSRDTFQYGLTEGEIGLREQIAALAAKRGIDTNARHVLVTSGSQQALDLVARVFVNPGDGIVVERPAYLAALQAFALSEARMLSAPSDADGIDVDRVETLLSTQRVKAVYLVPNFGNPSGGTLTLERRKRLVELAARHRALLIEDDPYGDLRLRGEPLPSLYEIAQQTDGAQDLVIYLSSFSKILSPGLRTGWMVLPDAYYSNVAVAKQAIDLHSCTLSQRIIERYLASGRLPQRLTVLRDAYRQRCDALCAALERHLGDAIRFNRPDGGMFLWAQFDADVDASAVLARAIAAGVVFVPGSAFYADEPQRNTLRLSYSTITRETAGEAAKRLAMALREA